MTSSKAKIMAVVVTFNRITMLQETIWAIEQQTLPVSKIIIVDNASSDETEQFGISLLKIKTNILYYRLPENTGGAGGFNYGLKKAFEHGADYFWLMDDDVYAEKHALEYLFEAARKYSGTFYCSHVVGKDRMPMNLPDIDTRGGDNGYATWNQYLIQSVIKVRACTFVSVLITRDAVNKAGFPLKDMFIWGDDGEYTHRLSNLMSGYLVGKSIVEHRREIQKKISIFNETDRKRIELFFFFYRNNVYLARKYKTRAQLIVFITYGLIDAAKSLLNRNVKTMWIILKGIFSGFFFNPVIEYGKKD
nr:glycosyltransferase family 2 protein [uncultured Desulfobacter sp.]